MSRRLFFICFINSLHLLPTEVGSPPDPLEGLSPLDSTFTVIFNRLTSTHFHQDLFVSVFPYFMNCENSVIFVDHNDRTPHSHLSTVPCSIRSDQGLPRSYGPTLLVSNKTFGT